MGLSTFRFFWGILCKDKYSYMTGWESARAGYPLNQNPHIYGSNEFNMWYIGWNDFIDNHYDILYIHKDIVYLSYEPVIQIFSRDY